jgi:hypothetical protein
LIIFRNGALPFSGGFFLILKPRMNAAFVKMLRQITQADHKRFNIREMGVLDHHFIVFHIAF